ncbi:rho guanine nucleotide exchange factor 16 [Denticeps clupeoides]|uniref:rho guanine nucleotide exchange factor 16 n=1 Tax=Denticeps clupeoides TaxID=299321 RepID=UPI0010A55E1D|nr:rho guanine nucleotide exchange factor 16 [Denticeps clupeoides]
MSDEAPLLLESQLASSLQLDRTSDSSASYAEPTEPSAARLPEIMVDDAEDGQIVLSTRSKAALKLGTQQLIPRNLAVASRPKNRHHTTVVTLPVELVSHKAKYASHVPSTSCEDYDSDDGGFSMRRNLRNKSYRAAVTSLNPDGTEPGMVEPSLTVVAEEKTPSPQSSQRTRRKTTLGRRRNQKQRGSFKDEPRLYQEIRERGLQNVDDDFTVLETPQEDQGIVVKNYRPAHLTWSQLPQVKDTGILQSVSAEERKRQEAIFEILTSEYSYLHSLSILVRNFRGNQELKCTMTTTEHHHLFSNIAVILEVSKRFFEDLERRHQINPVIDDISDIVLNHATNNFDPYIIYCSNETFQQRTLQKLLTSNTAFKEALKRIESSEECGFLPMISFLILPMQRVTRLPLLMDTVCQKTPHQTSKYTLACCALKAISKLVKSCNDGARRMERTEQMYTIQKQMDFGKIKPFPLVSASRWLQKKGEFAICAEELGFWKAFGQKSYHLFLFNDVLIATKKKGEESYVVLDYATLGNVEVEVDLPGSTNPLYLRLRMKKNSEGRAEMMGLVAESKLDKARWVTALRKHRQTESLTSIVDLPQYEATKAYMPKGPDELGLQQAEVVIVEQQVEDWCHGERMRDGEQGWFPASCTKEITSRTAMECNMRRMERLRKETNV